MMYIFCACCAIQNSECIWLRACATFWFICMSNSWCVCVCLYSIYRNSLDYSMKHQNSLSANFTHKKEGIHTYMSHAIQQIHIWIPPLASRLHTLPYARLFYSPLFLCGKSQKKIKFIANTLIARQTMRKNLLQLQKREVSERKRKRDRRNTHP